MSTKIEWTDETWNPVTGCTEVSPGCDHCYAKTMHERFNGPGSFSTVTLHPERLEKALRWRKPRKVFVNSMSDLFHKDVPDEYIAKVFAVMAACPQHTFQVLTKRHGRMRSLLSSLDFDLAVATEWSKLGTLAGSLLEDHTPPYPLPNVWLGVSVEDQQRANLRIPALLETPAARRFLSMEPLLGRVTFRCAPWAPVIDSGHLDSLKGIDWVIAGGESGQGARPMHPMWVRTIRDECGEAKVPFLFKQWGEWQDGSAAPWQRGTDHIIVADGRHEPSKDHWAKDDRGWWTSDLIKARERREPGTENATFVSRVGKKSAGRLLDGRTWDEFPEAVA